MTRPILTATPNDTSDDPPYAVAALYRFVRITAPSALRDTLQKSMTEHALCGTLLVAEEGINGTIAGTRAGIDAVLSHIRTLPDCAGLEWKEGTATEQPFHRMKVRLKREIVTMGQPDIDPRATVGAYVEPGDWNALIAADDVEILAMRGDAVDAAMDEDPALARALVLGDPLDSETTLGPLITPKAADFVRRQIVEAIADGATAHVDAGAFERDAPGSAYLAPQVLGGVGHAMDVMREESFGPVIGVMKVADDEEAVRLMNDSDFGLTASIWTSDAEAAIAIGERLETGTVFMNRCDYLDPALAWTGVKATGRGVTLSALGYHALTRPKSFHLRTDTG
mgnify:CR=1 FL=1